MPSAAWNPPHCKAQYEGSLGTVKPNIKLSQYDIRSVLWNVWIFTFTKIGGLASKGVTQAKSGREENTTSWRHTMSPFKLTTNCSQVWNIYIFFQLERKLSLAGFVSLSCRICQCCRFVVPHLCTGALWPYLSFALEDNKFIIYAAAGLEAGSSICRTWPCERWPLWVRFSLQ